MSAENIEDAVRAAIEFFQHLYRDAELHGVLLEEVRERDDQTWEVTIGYDRVVNDTPPMTVIARETKYERVYKAIAVDKPSGTAQSMVMRTV
ncbi:MAG: hypothetical protein HQ567_13105 [Candidatus Nealsonbacteria bacterium]|nr:hypothetical protein [Candidatus Nealsonbacteria bacterium]